MATLTRTKRPRPRCGRSIRAHNWHVYRFLRAFSSAGPAESRSWHLGSTIGTFRRVVYSADPSRSWYAGNSVYSLRPICLQDLFLCFPCDESALGHLVKHMSAPFPSCVTCKRRLCVIFSTQPKSTHVFPFRTQLTKPVMSSYYHFLP